MRAKGGGLGWNKSMGILAAEAFVVQSTYHRTKQKFQSNSFLSKDMILPINNISNWRHTRQQKQRQIEKFKIRENSTQIDYDFNIGDEFTVRKNQAYKYE